jgi:prepilin-type N-terminal cleavage/methylation domain-containing protein
MNPKRDCLKRQKGFSLIELLIVVAIILIIAAIAIPNFMRARMSANESSAAQSLRTINTAEMSYAAAYPTIGFTNLTNLGTSSPCTPSPASGCFIDTFLANSASSGSGKDGYLFTVVLSSAAAYTSTANALSINQTGTRSFCSDQTGLIYYLDGANGCTPTSGSPLQ